MTENENLINLKNSISSLEDKSFGIYFFVMDTKGNATAGVANIYEHVKLLRELGYNAILLHEKNDYTPVTNWLGSEYSELPHISIESQQLKVNTSDFIVIPEVFANIIEQTSKLPCKRIVFSQSYDYIMELLLPTRTWSDYGITECITTCSTQKDYLQDLFGSKLKTHVIPVSIPEYFKPSTKPRKPVVVVQSRDQRHLVKIFKTFYIKYPHLKWVSFKDMRELSREDFATVLQEACVSVWVDEVSGFGTFPLESMKSGVPVIGKVPNLVPEWMTDKNGLWTNNVLSIPDILAQYFQAWLEDREPSELYDEMEKVKTLYTESEQKTKLIEVYTSIFTERHKELKQLLPTEEITTETPSKNE